MLCSSWAVKRLQRKYSKFTNDLAVPIGGRIVPRFQELTPEKLGRV